jgi:fatty-acyl-CoA synthase
MGELEVRGPWVASGYYCNADSADRFTDDGWFRSGDVVSIESRGCVTIRDRAKDLIKSGGEWISSVALENALMAHPDVAEAAVIAVPHPKWDERPLAAVVLKAGHSASAESLLGFLQPQFSRWALPDAIECFLKKPRRKFAKAITTPAGCCLQRSSTPIRIQRFSRWQNSRLPTRSFSKAPPAR